MDVFDAASTYAKLAPKLLRSYALETADGTGHGAPADVSKREVRLLLEEVTAANVQRFPAVGLGEDWRLQAANTNGAALVNRESAVHVCAFTG